MEMDLGGVIEKIKQEGVEKAEEQARDIISKAEAGAEEISRSAERQKQEILKQAREEAGRTRTNGESAVKQAARDVIISLEAQIAALLKTVVKKEVSDALSSDVIKDIIIKLVTHCAERGDFDLEILLSEQDKKNLRDVLENALQKELKKGVTFKVSPAVKRGFRVGEKNRNLYYDFTDDAIAEAFYFYLNKKVKEILNSGLEDVR
ncbi:MAG: hypothetical protein KAS86_04925 [Candidatus Omnitrophica bacterium]|nr:hypothetical protein [Candidatus Omnitrophota bacterium]